MIVVGDIGPWSAGLTDGERAARCRELRALSLVYCGSAHRLTVTLGEAAIDPAALETARAELSAIPALRRRRLLAAYVALLPARSDTIRTKIA
jgi:hypothetical protein